MPTLVRRRKLGNSSARGIVSNSTTGIQWVRNDRGIPHDDIYIRWGCTSNLPNPDAVVVNTAASIHEVGDKVGFRMKLDEAGLCPKTFCFTGQQAQDWFNGNEFLEAPNHQEFWNKTYVARPPKHSQGRFIFKGNFNECVAQIERWNKGGGYISEFINKIAEYRVFVISGRAVAVAKKTPADPQALAWNVAQGGRFDNVNWGDWPLKAVKVAIQGFNISRLDFGGVDVMVDGAGNVTILEINSAPSLTSPYRQQCMAKGLDYIVEHGKARLTLSEERGGYRKFIHPAVCNGAWTSN